jgi:DNA-binding transcriptional regulator YdaS (Cro superfamily)
MPLDVKVLIDAASRNCQGGKAGLARELGVTPQKVSAWYAGREELPIPQRGAMADIAGRSAASEIAEAIMERSEGKPFAERLRRALGKSLAAVLVFAGLSHHGDEARAASLDPTASNV